MRNLLLLLKMTVGVKTLKISPRSSVNRAGPRLYYIYIFFLQGLQNAVFGDCCRRLVRVDVDCSVNVSRVLLLYCD